MNRVIETIPSSAMDASVGQLTAHFQARHIIAFGWITLSAGMYISNFFGESLAG